MNPVSVTDVCESSIITVQIIKFTPVKYGTDNSQTWPAFTDTVDAAGTCGEKRIELDADSPSFLSVVPDSISPETAPFQIDFNSNQAAEEDIKSHTVSYTV